MCAVAALALMVPTEALAQTSGPSPYRLVDDWAQLPDGRRMGAVGKVTMDPDGDKFSPTGDMLLRLGTPGMAGSGRDSFNSPFDVVVAPNGNVFIADGHNANGNNRVKHVRR